MRLKAYYAASVDAAIRRARLDLGDEAMLLESRPAPAEARHLGAHEVVFALPDATTSSARPRAGVNVREMSDSAAAPVHSSRMEAEMLAAAVTHSSLLTATLGVGALAQELVALYCGLCSNDYSVAAAREILQDVINLPIRDEGGKVNPNLLQDAVREVLSTHLSVEPVVGQQGRMASRGACVVAVVGPPGVGKTSSLVKLATRWGIPSAKPMTIISLDNYRVGGSEQLRTYAAILGATFVEVERPSMLTRIVRDAPASSWIWIDTPGLGPKDSEVLSELAGSLTDDSIDVHLVLPATLRSLELEEVWGRYSCFRPNRLLFTRLDEAACLGSLWTALRVTKLPLSFLGTGQRIPDDIQPASATELLQRAVDGLAALRGSNLAKARATGK